MELAGGGCGESVAAEGAVGGARIVKGEGVAGALCGPGGGGGEAWKRLHLSLDMETCFMVPCSNDMA